MLRILALNHDAGGANAIAPVVRHLRRRRVGRVVVVAGPYAADVFRWRRLAFHRPTEYGRGLRLERQAAAILARGRPDVILSGASWGDTIEKAAWGIGRSAGIPSLAVLDMWSMYWQRFSDLNTGRRLMHLPTRVAVIDEAARRAMTEVGFLSGQVVVTGQPHFDYLKEIRGRVARRGEAWRRSLPFRSDAFLVLFASESHSADLGRTVSCPSYLGYTEQGVLDQLVRVLEKLAHNGRETVGLVVKLHPKEVAGPRLRTTFPVHVVRDGDPLPIIARADAVVGMTSMLLVEAAFLGRPAISFQPIPARADTMWPNRIGLTRPVYSAPELEAVLRRLMDAPRDGRPPMEAMDGLADGKAAQRVTKALLDLLERR